jgi:hypothetical protein
MKKKQNEDFDIRAELQGQFRKVRNCRGNKLEKARLLVEITKLLQGLEEKPEIVVKDETPKKEETVQEYAKRLKGK